MKKKLVFIKLGGSLITDKEKPYTVKVEIIKAIAKDFKEVKDTMKDTVFILGNGAGSFGHYAAVTEKTDDPYGFSFVQQKVKELNSIVTAVLIDQKVPAISVHQSSILTTSNGTLDSLFLDSLNGLLESGITPVVYGDIVYDNVKKSEIISTERIFTILNDSLDYDYEIKTVLYMTTVDGFLDENNKPIPLVTETNYEIFKKNLFKTRGFDVTGGMGQKIEQALRLTKRGVQTQIVNGNTKNILSKILLKKEMIGTLVSPTER